jgi:catechol 2,3-dioxygenase-like lactoylglutathione lyase family enzyme
MARWSLTPERFGGPEERAVERTLFPILYARDLPRLTRFYRDLLGMAETFRYPAEGKAAFVTVEHGNAELGLGTCQQTPGLEGRPLIQPTAGRGFELCIYVPDVWFTKSACRRRMSCRTRPAQATEPRR